MYTSFETPAAAAPSAARRFQIRPLSTGEILDRTLALYGSAFWFCTGAAMLSAIVSLLSGASRIIYLQVYHLSPLTPIYGEPGLLLIVGVWSLLGVVAYGLSHAVLTWGLGSAYLGRPAPLAAAFRVVRQRWLRYTGLTIMQLLVAGWPSIVAYAIFGLSLLVVKNAGAVAIGIAAIIGGLLALASLPYSIYRYLQVSLAMPACALEGLPVMASLRRSRELLPDRKGRVFVVFLLVGALYMALGMVVGVLAIFEVRGQGNFILLQIIALLLTFAAAALLQPLFSAAFTIVYYDERVRREGFDIQFMMSEGKLAGPGAGVSAVAGVSAAAGVSAVAGASAMPVNGYAQGQAYNAPGQGHGAPGQGATGQGRSSPAQAGYVAGQSGYAPVANASSAGQTNPGA